MQDKLVTEKECSLIHQGVDDKLERILEGVQETRELKDILNPKFATLTQKVDNHLEQHKTKWSAWQIALTSVLAVGTVGMFIVGLIVALK